MKLYIACDHAGYEMKLLIIKLLKKFNNLNVVDCGAFSFDKDDDFPDFMHEVGYMVSKDSNNSVGVVVGGSGIGESILLNRYNGVRCGIYFGSNTDVVKNAREHDNINCIAIGARFVDVSSIELALGLFLETPFLKDKKYFRRVNKINIIKNDII